MGATTPIARPPLYRQMQTQRGPPLMEKFIEYEKLSKKEKKKIDAAKRGSWGNLNPVTRTPPNPKAYNRDKAKQEFRRESE